MYIEPIREEQRLSREEAIRILKGSGFTDEEANKFLDEPDKGKRLAISIAVEDRHKKEKK